LRYWNGNDLLRLLWSANLRDWMRCSGTIPDYFVDLKRQ
jgi:hypothetical protein